MTFGQKSKSEDWHILEERSYRVYWKFEYEKSGQHFDRAENVNLKDVHVVAVVEMQRKEVTYAPMDHKRTYNIMLTQEKTTTYQSFFYILYCISASNHFWVFGINASEDGYYLHWEEMNSHQDFKNIFDDHNFWYNGTVLVLIRLQYKYEAYYW